MTNRHDFVPFFINSNIIHKQENVKDFNEFMYSCGNNIGNHYITYSLIKECCGDFKNIRHIPNIYRYDFTKSDKDIDIINNQATHVFFILQDQLRIEKEYGGINLPYEKLINFIRKINKPIIIAGFGANHFQKYTSDFYKQLSPDLVYFLKFISDNSVEIGLRGEYTKEILEKLGIKNTRVIGCPSYYESGRNRIIVKKPLTDVMQILSTADYGENPNQLKYCYTILQDGNSKKLIDAIAFGNFDYDYSKHEVGLMLNRRYRVFSDIASWKAFASKFRFVAGRRMHGTILALNAGVPAVCYNPDLRASEMCAFLGIPHNKNINCNTDLIELYNQLDIDAVNAKYPTLYDNFEQFMLKNGVKLRTNKELQNLMPITELKLYNKNFYLDFIRTHTSRSIKQEYKKFATVLNLTYTK